MEKRDTSVNEYKLQEFCQFEGEALADSIKELFEDMCSNAKSFKDVTNVANSISTAIHSAKY